MPSESGFGVPTVTEFVAKCVTSAGEDVTQGVGQKSKDIYDGHEIDNAPISARYTCNGTSTTCEEKDCLAVDSTHRWITSQNLKDDPLTVLEEGEAQCGNYGACSIMGGDLISTASAITRDECILLAKTYKSYNPDKKPDHKEQKYVNMCLDLDGNSDSSEEMVSASDDPDELELILDINIIIENINSRGGEKIITAQMIFSNQKDSHLFSKSFDFVYQKNEALYKSEIFHPLTSLLNYYAYLHIAYELDAYQYLGGNQYFIKAQNIASNGKSSLYPKNWQTRLQKLRREQENYTYRNLKYNFFTAYDILELDETNIKEGYKFYDNFYEAIIEYDAYYGYSKPLIQFLNAYNLDIVDIAKELRFNTIIDFLSIYDESNRPIYQKYYQD